MRVAFAPTAAFVLAVDMPGMPRHNEHSAAPRYGESPLPEWVPPPRRTHVTSRREKQPSYCPVHHTELPPPDSVMNALNAKRPCSLRGAVLSEVPV
jgi:hypothetical protein